MNLKVFNFPCKLHNDIVNISKNILHIDEPVSQCAVGNEGGFNVRANTKKAEKPKGNFLTRLKANKELLILSMPGAVWFLFFAYLPLSYPWFSASFALRISSLSVRKILYSLSPGIPMLTPSFRYAMPLSKVFFPDI